MKNGTSIACFISPHGFGHAARASAVMAAIRDKAPETSLEIFTTVPEWFFRSSLSGPFSYHPVPTDIGLAQKHPLEADLGETLGRLDAFLPFDQAMVARLSEEIRKSGCRLVLCDIAPLGIAVAKKADVPSVLMENFTWDWIYESFRDRHPGFERHVGYLQGMFEQADYRIQAEPVCLRRRAHVTIPPVCRKAQASPWQIRKSLKIPPDRKLVVITMGGIPAHLGFLEKLHARQEACFVIAGAGQVVKTDRNLILLPAQSGYFHPDLIQASDAVIGKLGYSTMAEVYQAGVPFGYVGRDDFPESAVLAGFVEKEMAGFSIPHEDFETGAWLPRLPEILALPKIFRDRTNGAAQAAEFIIGRIGWKTGQN